MKTNLARLLACLLACLLLAAPLTACNSGEENGDTGSESTSVSTPADDSGSESESVSASETESTSESETDPEAKPDFTSLTIAGVDVQNFSVVTPNDMPSGQIEAVDEFIQWIADATGHTLPKITAAETADHEIVIGQNVRENANVAAAVSEIENDGYAYVVDGGNLYISASTGRGVVYGLYDFLENHLGVRFYDPDFTVRHDIGALSFVEGMKEVFSPPINARVHNFVWNSAIDSRFALISKRNSGLSGLYVGDTISIGAGSGHTLLQWAGIDASMFHPNPCLQDETVYETVLTNIMADLVKDADRNAVLVTQGDGSPFCKCEKCTTFEAAHGNTHMASMLDFCNRLVADINKTYPDMKVITYCYEYSRGIPTNMEVDDHVIIDFCLDKACFNHALNDPDCSANVAVLAELCAWDELCKVDNLFVYDYPINFGSALPGPNFYVMWDNFQVFKELNVSGLYQCGGFDTRGLAPLRYYLRSHLTWNPDMTEEEYYALFHGFIEDYYGDAAPYIKAHIDSIYAPENLKGCSAMFAPMEAFLPVTDADGKKDLTALRAQYAYFSDALALDTLTEDERAHVEYASMIMLNALKNELHGKERRELEAVWCEYKEKYGLPDGVLI